jgi:hypothetical protein
MRVRCYRLETLMRLLNVEVLSNQKVETQHAM